MKHICYLVILVNLTAISCRHSAKSSIDRADSANAAILDTALKNNSIVVDEGSSFFLVRAANLLFTIKQTTDTAINKLDNLQIKGFADSLRSIHTTMSDTIRMIAIEKNISLPDTLTNDKLMEIQTMKQSDDKGYLAIIIKEYTLALELFQNAMLDAKEPAVRSFADASLPGIRKRLDRARFLFKELQ